MLLQLGYFSEVPCQSELSFIFFLGSEWRKYGAALPIFADAFPNSIIYLSIHAYLWNTDYVSGTKLLFTLEKEKKLLKVFFCYLSPLFAHSPRIST